LQRQSLAVLGRQQEAVTTPPWADKAPVRLVEAMASVPKRNRSGLPIMTSRFRPHRDRRGERGRGP